MVTTSTTRGYPPEFTIAFVVHGDVPLLERTIPTTIETLCRGTTRSYDLLLVVDGAETAPVPDILTRAHTEWGMDEVRLRWRSRHRAGGDPSNNGHVHLTPAKGRFLLSLEGDVVAFRAGDGDVLDAVARAFEACPQLALATRIDDHDCWQWGLEEVGPPFGQGIRSVNRVSSHFLIYELPRTIRVMRSAGGPPADQFHDSDDRWFNYEDWLSKTFTLGAGPGIGYLDELPIRVFHCDAKVAPASALYTRRLDVRLRVFEERRKLVESGRRGA